MNPERERFARILEEQVADANKRNRGYGRPFTVRFSCGTPWTVTGALAEEARAFARSLR